MKFIKISKYIYKNYINKNEFYPIVNTNILIINTGQCKNGTGAVGCGPQEEFRACSDVAITNSDGSADDTPNTLVDPEIYVPKKSADIGSNDDIYNEIDVGGKDSYLQSGKRDSKLLQMHLRNI